MSGQLREVRRGPPGDAGGQRRLGRRQPGRLLLVLRRPARPSTRAPARTSRSQGRPQTGLQLVQRAGLPAPIRSPRRCKMPHGARAVHRRRQRADPRLPRLARTPTSTSSASRATSATRATFRADFVRREYHDYYDLTGPLDRHGDDPVGDTHGPRPHRQLERLPARVHRPPHAVRLPARPAASTSAATGRGPTSSATSSARPAAPARSAAAATSIPSTSTGRGTPPSATSARTSATASASTGRTTSRCRGLRRPQLRPRPGYRHGHAVRGRRHVDIEDLRHEPGLLQRPRRLRDVLLHVARRVPHGDRLPDGPLAVLLATRSRTRSSSSSRRRSTTSSTRSTSSPPNTTVPNRECRTAPTPPSTRSRRPRRRVPRNTGANWNYGPLFGQADRAAAYQTPRYFQVASASASSRLSRSASRAPAPPGPFFLAGVSARGASFPPRARP